VKWLGLFVLLSAILPISGWLRRRPRETPKIWMLIGFLPFVTDPFHLLMAGISHTWWPGHASGTDITVLDGLVLALYLNLPSSPNRLPFRLPMVLYFLTVLLSVLQAQWKMEALFYVWQLLRMFFVYATIAKACACDDRVPLSLLKGMTAGLIMEAGVVLFQRYALGMILADGTFAGHNFLGLLSHFIVFPNLALILAGERGLFVGAVLVAGLIVEVYTTSRATIGLAGFGYVLMFMLSAVRQWTPRKMIFFVMGLVAISAVAPVAILSFEKRFAVEDVHEFDERAAFERAAAMILSDHPLGVGANQYVVVAGTQGYNKAAGVPQATGQNDAVVHNLYWLVAAETGYPGVITFVVLLLCPLAVAFRCGWRNRKDRRGDLLIGLGVSLLVVYLHCLYEWILINYQGQYIFVMEVGLVAGLAQQLGYWQRSSYAQHKVLPQRLANPQ